MKKRKLKKYVLPTLYLLVLGVMATGITFLSQNLLNQKVENDERYHYTMSVFNEEETTNNETEPETDTENTEELKIVKPFTSDKVSVAKEYYNQEESAENQEKALIYYEGTYMPNTGVLYESDETFDVVSVLDGTVKDIKTDEILGTVITIENTDSLTTIYYTLGETKVNVGDKVTQNQVIAISGASKLETTKANTLLFETYLNGIITNPNTLFDKSVSELN